MRATWLLPVGLALGLRAASAGAAPRPEIEAMVADVSQAEATAIVMDLVAFGTRYSGTPGCDAAADLLAARLSASGLTPTLQPFPWGARTLRNVTARHVGHVRPDEVVLVLAHYDSTSQTPTTSAPGADDNASGVAAVLEAARVLAPHRFERTIEFLLTSGEEQGLLGSDFHAEEAWTDGVSYVGVINHDMIGYWPNGWGRNLDVCGTTGSEAVVDAYAQALRDYVPGVPVNARYDWGVCGDDQVSYDLRGWPALIVMDCYEAHLGLGGESTPHYHRTSDTPSTLDFGRMTQVVRATTATLAELAVPLERTLHRNDALDGRRHAGGVLRPGSPSGGDATRIDPAHPATTSTYGPPEPAVMPGDGEPVGDGARGVIVFYETDRDETIRLARRDADSDGRLDVVVSF